MTTEKRGLPRALALLAFLARAAGVLVHRPHSRRRANFAVAQGQGGQLLATQGAGDLCDRTYYQPSRLEKQFYRHALAWTDNARPLCSRLSNFSKEWIAQNKAGGAAGSGFSRMCKKGKPAKAIEPLLGVLRDPRVLCNTSGTSGSAADFAHSVEWLVLDDQPGRNTSQDGSDSNNYLFDVGGGPFAKSLQFLVGAYEERGIVFDHVFSWQPSLLSTDDYWAGVPGEVQSFWEPRLTLYRNVSLTPSRRHAANNPIQHIQHHCRPTDFCSLKLDLHKPSMEQSLVQRMLNATTGLGLVLDELFYDHRVHGIMQRHGWGKDVMGTFLDSYITFTRLRELGIRAHPWI